MGSRISKPIIGCSPEPHGMQKCPLPRQVARRLEIRNGRQGPGPHEKCLSSWISARMSCCVDLREKEGGRGAAEKGGNQGECQQPRHYSSRFPRPTLPLEPRSLPCSHFIIKIPFSSWISLSNKTPTNVGVTEPHEQADSASPQSSEAGSPRGQRRAWPGTGAPPGRPGAGSGRC